MPKKSSNVVLRNFFRKAANKTVAAAKKKAVFYAKHPATLMKDVERGARFVKTIQGAGDYGIPHSAGIVSGPAIHDGGMMIEHSARKGYSHPRTRVMGKGEMCISHSEYIGELISSATTGTSNFVSQSYGINPGNSGLFPWLSATAINFQNYRFKKLIFEYVPLVSESTATTAATLTSMGTVIMATQYDSVLGPYDNKATMENSDYSISAKPSSKIRHAIECEPKYNPLGVLYVSGNQDPDATNISDADVRFQNLGIFQIASSNIPIASSTALDLGEIWVHYEVELYKPQLNAGLSNILSAHATTTTAVDAGLLTGMSLTSSSPLRLTFSATTFSFPLSITQGRYLCVYDFVGASAEASITPPSLSVANGSALSILNGAAGTGTAALDYCPPDNAGYNTPITMLAFIVEVNAPGSALCTVTLSGGDFAPGTCTRAELMVTPWNVDTV